MATNNPKFIVSNGAFFGIAPATLLLLAIPFLLMRYKIPLYDLGNGYEVINWDLADLIGLGTLIFATSSLFILVGRKIRKSTHRIVLAAAFLLGFLWIWAELAVGIFTNLGN